MAKPPVRRRFNPAPRKPGTAVAVRPRAEVVLPSSVVPSAQPPVLVQTYSEPTAERILTSYDQYAELAYGGNAVVFGLQNTLMRLFSEARLCWRDLDDKKLTYKIAADQLAKLFRPWPNGFTGDMLSRMIQDAGLAGNAYVRDAGNRLERLRPDWVTIVSWVTLDELGHEIREVVGYMYDPTGDPERSLAWYPVEEVCHWAPIPDPSANFRGMSWFTPALREINADRAMTEHREKFWRNSATPNIIIKYQGTIKPEQKVALAESIAAKHGGPDKAGRTLVLDSGADLEVVGSKMSDAQFQEVLAATENRMAVAAGVPALLAGLKEGLDAAAWSMYKQAIRAFADIRIRPDWRSACAALSVLVDVPKGHELWYDTRDIAALQESEKESADRMQVVMTTINSGITAGFEPDSVVKAVSAGDETLLVHSGLVSVQLMQPGAQEQPADETDPAAEPDTPADSGEEDSVDRALVTGLMDELRRSRESSQHLAGRALDMAFDAVARGWTAETFDEDKVNRDGGGQFASNPGRKLAAALSSLAGGMLSRNDNYALVEFPDRDGAPDGRYVEFESDDDGTVAMHLFADDGEVVDDGDESRPVTVNVAEGEFRDFAAKAAVELADRNTPLDPTSAASVALHAMLAVSPGAAVSNDDGSYIDLSADSDGMYRLEVGDAEGNSRQVELSRDEASAFVAASVLGAMPDHLARSEIRRARDEAEYKKLLAAGRIKHGDDGKFSRIAGVGLDGLKVPDLKARAKAAGVKGYSKMRRGELLAALSGDAPAPGDDLDGMLVPRLREIAKAEGVKNSSKLRKPQLIEAIRYMRASDGSAAEPQAPKADGRAATADTSARPQVSPDAARALGEMAIEVEELVAKNASARAIQHRLNARVKRLNTDSPDAGPVKAAAAEVDEMVKAGASGDEVVARLRARLAGHGLVSQERAGTTVAYDPARHDAMGPAVPGSAVMVVRPGYSSDDGKVLIERPVVQDQGGSVGKVSARPQVDLPPSGEDQARTRAMDALYRFGARDGETMGIEQLRAAMGGSRAEQDATLDQLSRERLINLMPQSNQKILTDERRAAALRMGGEDKTLVMLGSAASLSGEDQARTRQARIDSDVRQAIQDLPRTGGGRTRIADLRERLSGMSREEQDTTLRRMASEGSIVLTPQEDAKRLKSGDREAAVQFGDQANHWVTLPGEQREDAARQRQARIDTAMRDADVLAEIEDVVLTSGNSEDPAAAERLLQSWAAGRGRTGDPLIAEAIAHTRNGDMASLRAMLDREANARGLTRIGGDMTKGQDQVVSFDRKLHEPVGGDIKPGAKVVVTRPGYRLTTEDGETVKLGGNQGRAQVTALNAQEIASLEHGGGWGQDTLSWDEIRQRQAGGGTSLPTPGTPRSEAQLRQDVRDAYTRLAERPGKLVSLVRLRAELGGTREEQDRVLKQMDREGLILLEPDPNTKALPPQAHEAAIRIGGKDTHFITLR